MGVSGRTRWETARCGVGGSEQVVGASKVSGVKRKRR